MRRAASHPLSRFRDRPCRPRSGAGGRAPHRRARKVLWHKRLAGVSPRAQGFQHIPEPVPGSRKDPQTHGGFHIFGTGRYRERRLTFARQRSAASLVREISLYRRRDQRMLKLRKLEKFFETKAGRIYVLRNIDLDVAEGEFLTIMGPSGAGKSSLLGIVGLLDAAWQGEYYLLDQPVHRLNLKQRAELNKRTIGFVFQQYHLLDNLTVYENLEIPLSYRNIPRSERAAIVADTLDRFNIVGKKDLYPNQLSGGQQQLVAVARAVIASPKLILADEPTGNLHSAQGREIMELFKRLNDQGTTIIQVTHSEVNASYGHRTIELFDGWIASERRNEAVVNEVL